MDAHNDSQDSKLAFDKTESQEAIASDVEAVVQYYERKIGIFESTMDLLKQNLKRTSSRYSNLLSLYRPIKQSYDAMLDRVEELEEEKLTLALELKKKSSTSELNRVKLESARDQVTKLEKFVEQFQSICSYLNINVTEVLESMALPSTELIPNGPLVPHEEIAKDIATKTQSHQENHSVEKDLPEKSIIKDDEMSLPKLLDLEVVNQDLLDISLVDELKENNMGIDLLNVPSKDASFCEERSCRSSVVDSLPDEVGVTTDKLLLTSPNIKICMEKKDLQAYKSQKGVFMFYPDNDYTWAKNYVCSPDFNWPTKGEIRFSLPSNFLETKTVRTLNSQSVALRASLWDILPFKTVVYNSRKDIPVNQPIEGGYFLVDILKSEEHCISGGEDAIDFGDENQGMTYSQVMELPSELIRVEFRPKNHYFYLNAKQAMPEFFKKLLEYDATEATSNFDIADEIWPFRNVSYSSFDCIPDEQPVKGFYIFQRQQNQMMKLGEKPISTKKKSPRRLNASKSMKIPSSIRFISPWEPKNILEDNSDIMANFSLRKFLTSVEVTHPTPNENYTHKERPLSSIILSKNTSNGSSTYKAPLKLPNSCDKKPEGGVFMNILDPIKEEDSTTPIVTQPPSDQKSNQEIHQQKSTLEPKDKKKKRKKKNKKNK